MTKVTMDLIKELREKTQVGMMDCKKALEETDGDLEKAVEYLRKKGAAVAAKRADNATNNGHIEACLSSDLKTGVLVKISCETDFAANTQDMKAFAAQVCEHILKTQPTCAHDDTECLMKQPFANNTKLTLNDLLNDLIAKIAEKIKVENFAIFKIEDEGLVSAYIHPGASLGVLVELTTDKALDKNLDQVKQLAHDICMQIAVTSPLSITPEELNPEILEKEIAIAKAQLATSNKPANIIDKIIDGKMQKYYEDVCLLNQKFIKDDKVTIKNQVEQISKNTGLKIVVKKIKRFGIGK